ncbi:MAG: hypothetical protein HXX18_01745 [Bacteroidetes bacterium]|nr:hypothetical protein [Bacteroidota bacterium]
MLEKYLQIEALSIVFIGDFNPVIFQPFWLSSKELIREDEAKNAKIDIIHNEIVKYELDWINIEITRNRCVFKTTKEPYFDPLKDLVIGIFKILNETPIKSFGLNHTYELSLQTKEKYYNFGSKLTPLNYWDEELNDPRLMQLEVFEKERSDFKNGSRRIRITPSSDQTIPFGVSININNHYDLKSEVKKIDYITLLEDNWKTTFVQTKDIVNKLLIKIDL